MHNLDDENTAYHLHGIIRPHLCLLRIWRHRTSFPKPSSLRFTEVGCAAAWNRAFNLGRQADCIQSHKQNFLKICKKKELSVKEVGEAVGYPEPFYFSRILIKQLTGLAPKEYRNRFQQ